MYLTFGTLVNLHSNNEREFVNAIINNLHVMRAKIKIVHEKSKHSPSQGSVARATCDVEGMLSAWMDENSSGETGH